VLLQAKALTTAADWAHAYAELAKEKDVLAKENDVLAKEKDVLAKEKDVLVKEKDTLASVTKEKDEQVSVLTKKNRILTKEKEVLAKQLSQCTALGNLTGLLGTLVALVCGPLSPLGTFFGCSFVRSLLHVRCVQQQRRSMPQPQCRRGKQSQQVPSPRRDTRAL